MRRYFAAAVLLTAALHGTPVDSQQTDTPALAGYGVGNATCAEYGSLRLRKGTSDLFLSWAQGFISGANARCPLKQASGRLSPETIIGFLNSGCASDPLRTVSQVVDDLAARMSALKTIEECTDIAAAVAAATGR